MLTLAKDGMRTDLEKIWRACFDDSVEYVRYFFDYKYNPNACAVYVDETTGRPVAMLHMLDGQITEDSEISPVQYVYAAATRPDYRHRGIMKQLVEFAKRCAQIRGCKYMILVPRTKQQFRYYEKLGFYRCFKARTVYMTRHDLMALSGGTKHSVPPQRKEKRPSALTISDLHAVRRDVLVDREGFITWDRQHFKFAAGAFENSGGRIIIGSDGVDAGYAFCREKDGTVYVSELIAHTGFTETIIRNILSAYDSDRFVLRLPVYNEFFEPFGEITDYGMICSVNGRYPVNILTISGVHLPYFGLALEE